MASNPGGLGRKCFVTVGATASFRQLLEAVLRPDFFECLAVYGYNRLEVQCGPKQDFDWVGQQLANVKDFHGIAVKTFQYTTDMTSHVLECRGERVGDVQRQLAGCVISHAGSGTILEVMRIDAPLIVVPNPTLMDNHQLELAKECEKQGWAVIGDLRQAEIAQIYEDQFPHRGRRRNKVGWTISPPYEEPPFPVPEAERITLFDWMVLTCYPEEMKKQMHRDELRAMDGNAAARQQGVEPQQRHEDEVLGSMD